MTTTAVTITGASSTGQQHQSADSGAQSSPGVTAPIRSARASTQASRVMATIAHIAGLLTDAATPTATRR